MGEGEMRRSKMDVRQGTICWASASSEIKRIGVEWWIYGYRSGE
jgi:hypothetical protein